MNSAFCHWIQSGANACTRPRSTIPAILSPSTSNIGKDGHAANAVFSSTSRCVAVTARAGSGRSAPVRVSESMHARPYNGRTSYAAVATPAPYSDRQITRVDTQHVRAR